ncbi:MAG: hypothetical protein H0U05_03410 [Actinobacteria bacterium]|nr:hypothetical protein [Actinomycetota bacterium]
MGDEQLRWDRVGIDPSTDEVVATIETGYFPKWLAVEHGGVWVGVSGAPFDFEGCD